MCICRRNSSAISSGRKTCAKKAAARSCRPKKLSPKGWGLLLVSLAVSTFLFAQALRAAGGSSTNLDGLTTMITVAGQLLMILRYREQWILWIALNILSIVLWAENPSMYLMFGAYLLNSVYGFYNWSRLQKAAA